MTKWWKKNWLVALILLLAFFLSLMVVVPSGLRYCKNTSCGVMFWGANEHDGIWHLAVSNTLFLRSPYETPNMSGQRLGGYNYLLDFLIATTGRLTSINTSTLYFQILPVLWFSVFAFCTFRFARAYSKTKTYIYSLLFFGFFGSSLSYLLSLINRGTIWGSGGLLSMQSLQNLLNIQFSLSLIPFYLILTGLTEDKRNLQDYLKYGIYLFVALGLKFYTGVGIAVYMATDLVVRIIKEKKLSLTIFTKNILVAFFGVAASLLFYLPTSLDGSPLIFKPFATVNPLVEDSSLLYIPQIAQKIYGEQGIKLLILEVFILFLYVVFNYGSRIFALLGLINKEKGSVSRDTTISVFVTSILLLLIAALFVQRGVWWNTVQFLYVSMFLTNILAANGLDRLFRLGRRYGKLLGIGVILMTLPTNLDIVRSFAHFPGNSYIPDQEIAALRFLSGQEGGVVLADYLVTERSDKQLPTVREAYDTSYVAAYSGKQSFLNDLVQLDLMNTNYAERLKMVKTYDCTVLSLVSYVYELNNRPYIGNYEKCDKQLGEIFKNEMVTIYQTI